jgi:putative transposase
LGLLGLCPTLRDNLTRMARPPRLQAPGTLHHLIARGNERREVFRDDADRGDYLERLARYRKKLGFRLYAYCLMPNHVHLAVEQGPATLSELMHAQQSSYKQYFNRRHQRVGHLFQGRYKSFLVDGDRYFLALIRYIHGNPVKAGIVRESHLYPWSSARFFQEGVGPPWLDLERAIALLGPSRLELMAEGEGKLSAYEALVTYAGSVKGDETFAFEALREIRVPPQRGSGSTAESVALALAACAGLTLDDLSGPSRRRHVSRWRFLAAYLGRERLGIPVAEAARLFRRDESSLAEGVRLLEARVNRDPDFKDRVESIASNASLPARSGDNPKPRA